LKVDLRKSVVRFFTLAVATGLLATGARAQVSGQVNIKPRKTSGPRRETNATRQARIARTIQDTYSHRYEIYGGGGYLRFRSGEQLKKNNEVSWATAGNYFLNPKLAITASAQGSFGNAKAFQQYNNYGVFNPQINEYMFMGGATYRFYAKEKLAISATGQAGLGWGIFSGGDKGLPSTVLGMWPDGFKPAFSAGVNFDYNFYPNLAFRVTPMWMGTTFGGNLQNNTGFNAGFVYRFKRQ